MLGIVRPPSSEAYCFDVRNWAYCDAESLPWQSLLTFTRSLASNIKEITRFGQLHIKVWYRRNRLWYQPHWSRYTGSRLNYRAFFTSFFSRSSLLIIWIHTTPMSKEAFNYKMSYYNTPIAWRQKSRKEKIEPLHHLRKNKNKTKHGDQWNNCCTCSLTTY